MATSGTATWSPSLSEMFQEAYDRAGLPFQSGYDWVSAKRSFNLLAAEFANRGLNMWTFDSENTLLVAGTATITLPLDTVDVIDCSIRLNNANATSQTDLVIERISFSTYQQQPNKLTQGQPTQYCVQRLTAGPTLTLWPVPDSATTYYLNYTRMRRIEDAGAFNTTMDAPFRFYDAIIAGLAYRVAQKNVKSMALVPQLKAIYDEALELAQSEDRERASIMLIPWVGRY